MEKEDVVGNVLTYWFGTHYWSKRPPSAPTTYFDDLWQQRWFAKEALGVQVDAYLRDNFGKYVDMAIRGELDSFTETPHGTLALIILLDQFPRNIYRGTAQAWAGDPHALEIALKAIKDGVHKELKPIGRAMLYMPLLHAEDMDIQNQSVALYKELHDAEAHKEGQQMILDRFNIIAERHAKVIGMFGRYPERNIYLNRVSNVDEKAYLVG